MTKLKWIKDELNNLKILNSKNVLTKKDKELILEYDYVLRLETKCMILDKINQSLSNKNSKLFDELNDINIDSIFSNILSFYTPDGNTEAFKEKIEQYKSELLSL